MCDVGGTAEKNGNIVQSQTDPMKQDYTIEQPEQYTPL
jgi:hypothetical protein